MSLTLSRDHFMKTPAFIWVVFFSLVLPLAIYTAYSGFVVGELELPGGFRIVFRESQRDRIDESVGELSSEELENRQAELEERFGELERRVGQPPVSPQPRNLDLNGTWYSQGGLSYEIVQNGSFIAIQEIHPIFGVTAVGQGNIRGYLISINYQTASYASGKASMTVAPDGRSLHGTLRDAFSGYTTPISLNR